MRPSTRRSDDADVIRARLRALLADGPQPGGWVPDGAGAGRADDLSAAGAENDDGDDDREDDDGEDEDGEDEDEDDPDRWDTPLPGDPPLPVLGRHRAPGRTARVAPDRPAAWALWAAAVAAVLLVLGWTWLHRPDVEAAPAEVPRPSAAAAARSSGPAPTASGAAATGATGDVVVSVVGQVARPGLVTLAPGARVADALGAAGGLLPAADPAAVNAAAVLTDGQQIAVGVAGAVPAAPSGASGAGAAAGPVDLNAATVADLDALPGVGPVLAQRIVDHRAEHGRFTSVEQLDDVDGIGPALYARLAPKVRV